MRPMTGVDDAERTVSQSPASRLARPLRPYADIFLIPGAWRFSAAGVIGRMPMAMFGLGTVLLISATTGKYGVAGTVSAAGSLGYAFSSPRIARLADSRGQRRVLLPLLAVFATATAALIMAVQLGMPTWAFFVPGAIAGATMPSLGAMVRVRWSVLLAGSPRLHTAFSFESVADELCFIVGPAAVTLLATEVSPASGVGVAALLCVTGTLWFAAERGTEPDVLARGVDSPGSPRARESSPPPRTRLAPPAAKTTAAPPATKTTAAPPATKTTAAPPATKTTAAPPATKTTAEPSASQTPVASPGPRLSLAGRRVRGAAAPGLVVLAPVYLLLGAMFVSIDLSTVSFAQHFGHKPLAGFILGTYALGSATGGLWYGSRLWRAPAENRFAITLTLTVIGVGTFWAQPNLVMLTCGIYLCGLTIAPTLIAGFSLLEAQAKPGRRTEAMSWLSSGIAIGVAVGASAVGFIIDAYGPRVGYAFAAACGAASVLTCLAGLRRLRLPTAAADG
jgi:MFS family permease